MKPELSGPLVVWLLLPLWPYPLPSPQLCSSLIGLPGSQSSPILARKIPWDCKVCEFSSLFQCSAFWPHTWLLAGVHGCTRWAHSSPGSAGWPCPQGLWVVAAQPMETTVVGHPLKLRWRQPWQPLNHLWGHSFLFLKTRERLQLVSSRVESQKSNSLPLFHLSFLSPWSWQPLCWIIPSPPGFFWGSRLNLWFVPILISLSSSVSATPLAFSPKHVLISHHMNRLRSFQTFKFWFFLACSKMQKREKLRKI